MSELPIRLLQAMTEAGMDQPALAKAVGCTQGAISQILLGNTKRSKFLPDIADALGVDVKWLRGTGPKQPAPEAKTRPAKTTVMMPVEFPSGSALHEIFQSMLDGIPEYRTIDQAELSEMLARRLLAALGAAQGSENGPRRKPQTRPPAKRGQSRPKSNPG